MGKYFDKTVKDFRTKLAYHEYIKNRLFKLLVEKCEDFEFKKEYPPTEPYGIDIVGLKNILGKEAEIIAIEVLGIAEESIQKGKSIRSGQVEKIMTDVSKLLLRSKAPIKVLVFSTKEVRDHMKKLKKRNIEKGYTSWLQIEFYEMNEFVEKF